MVFVFDGKEMAEREGFEPPDDCSSTVFKTAAFDHSATSPDLGKLRENLHAAGRLFTNGAEKRNRTSDLLVTNQLLYRLSYLGDGRAIILS